MTLLLIFISFLLGIAFKKSFIAIGIVILFLLIKCFFYKRKLSQVILGTFLLGTGISFIPPFKQNSFVYVGIVYEVKDNYFLMTSRGEKLYCYEKETKREIGDILQIEGKTSELDFVTLESEFDFKNFLNNKGVYSELEIKNVKTKFSKKIFTVMVNFDNDIKQYFLDWVQYLKKEKSSSISRLTCQISICLIIIFLL